VEHFTGGTVLPPVALHCEIPEPSRSPGDRMPLARGRISHAGSPAASWPDAGPARLGEQPGAVPVLRSRNYDGDCASRPCSKAQLRTHRPAFPDRAAQVSLSVFGLLQLPPGKLQRPFIYLGKISYGLYVYHVLCLGGSTLLVGRFEARGRLGPLTAELVAMAPALPATVAMAVLSYR
jgi:hypothetical protein